MLDAAEIRDEIWPDPYSQGVYRSGDTDVKSTIIYNTSAMKQTLNEGTGGQREEEIVFSWGTPVGQQGGVFAVVLKAMQDFSRWRQEGRAFQVSCQPKGWGPWTSFFSPLFLSPRLSWQGTWDLFGSLVWVTRYLGEPAGWRSAQGETLLVLPLGKCPSQSSSKDAYDPVHSFLHYLYIQRAWAPAICQLQRYRDVLKRPRPHPWRVLCLCSSPPSAAS